MKTQLQPPTMHSGLAAGWLTCGRRLSDSAPTTAYCSLHILWQGQMTVTVVIASKHKRTARSFTQPGARAQGRLELVAVANEQLDNRRLRSVTLQRILDLGAADALGQRPLP